MASHTAAALGLAKPRASSAVERGNREEKLNTFKHRRQKLLLVNEKTDRSDISIS